MRRRTYLKLLLLLCLTVFAQAQIVPPYNQNFDSVNCTGWTHAALSGTDVWQRGTPAKFYMNQPSSAPNVWVTSLTSTTSANSVMYLQTPSFDLSNLTKVYLLSFAHEYQTFSYHGGNVEYSTDGGFTWLLLDGTSTQKYNWYNNPSCSGLSGKPSWSNNNYFSYMYSAHSLVALQGQSNVKFRFIYGGSSNPQEGWMIDNFSIIENVPDVVAMPGTQCNATKFFPTFTVSTALVYNSIGPPTFSNVTNYYFSYDSIWDGSDVLLGSKSQNINTIIPVWTQTFAMVPNLKARDYWVFYKHDFANNLTEGDENNNVGCMVLRIDSTFTIPEWKEDFEGPKDWWKKVGYNNYFEKGQSVVHQTEGTHSGKNSWAPKVPKYFASGTQTASIESPFMDFTAANNNVICFWYRAKSTYSSSPSKLRIEASNTFTQGFTYTMTVPFPRFTDWDCNCQSLWMMNGKNNGRIRFTHVDVMSNATYDQPVNFDDVYIGQPKPDFTIEHKNILSTPVTLTSDTLYYDLFNAGLISSPASNTEFYWSNDSLLDVSDILLGTVPEPIIASIGYLKRKYVYTKPTTAQGTYFIIYKLDAGNVATEMWENNNIGYYKLKQDPLIALPYYNDFETQANGWWHYATIGKDNWQLGTPTGTVLTSAFSGTACFNTTQSPTLSAMSRMHLYTPIFDFTSMINPVLEFDMKLTNGNWYDGGMNMSYSIDGGASWKILDTTNTSWMRWYYPQEYENWGGTDRKALFANYSQLLFQGNEWAFANVDQFNNRDGDRNTRYILDLNQFSGKPHVQFRFNLGCAKNDTTSLPVYFNLEGAVIDNFHIRSKFVDLLVPYKKSLMLSSLSPKVKFTMHLRNSGNYISTPTINKYYVSVDSILDVSDYYLGRDTISPIKPDMKRYINRWFNAPPSLSNYKYLIYELDIANSNIESNEVNNIGSWPLALDSVANYPYVQNFNDSILNGWHEYEIHQFYGTVMQNQWRLRNMVAPGEWLYGTQIKSGQIFSDQFNNANSLSSTPYWYLETPSFDFSNYNSLEMKFDMALFGSFASGGSGGNLQYSLNGGNTWTVLQTTVAAQAYNWYTASSIFSIGGPGWINVQKPVTLLDSVWFNINFLSGQPSVVFRFQYRSNVAPTGMGTPQGLRLDNFWIKGISISTGEKEEPKGFSNVYNYGNQLYVNYGILDDPSNKYELTLMNMLGQTMYSVKVELNKGSNEFTLPDNLSDGMYLVNISNGKNKLQQKIIVVK